MGAGTTTAHERALALLAQGASGEALAVLRDAVRAALDPEILNDLAVLADREGDPREAVDLLRALVRLHPDYAEAAENLRAAQLRIDDRPARQLPDDERRARFLQIVADARATHLADNVDYLFEPWGRELPATDTFGERLSVQLDVLERCGTFWEAIGDAESRELFLRWLAYRALGPAHVRLQLEPQAYRQAVIGLSARAMVAPTVARLAGLPMEWQLHHYDFSGLGLPIQAIGPPLPLASTMIFSQYAYRDPAAAAAPRPGDVVVDAGGCWGDTALWLAHVVGPSGHVHTFEPTPGNRRLLDHNLSLNPGLAPRITVWPDPLGAVPGERVWIPDVVAAGATMQAQAPDDPQRRMIELPIQSIDALVAAGGLPRVDFLKVDVEGADLGVLEGAAETIRSHRPRLAIACYHKPDDLVVIPDFIASLGVPYRWYLQCSTMTDVDTVAFAVAQ
ncbi:MAG TPA: FkbM family methyltransferase [Solirubrobacteraceae bacterium]|nr:FkbM family methyltransferase [Solirubrobacteraceae bacterium]